MNTLRVLMYHQVDQTKRNFLCVSVAQLEEQLDFIQSKYKIIRLSELLAHIEHGISLPDNALLITFDDGYENNYTLAYPIFKARNIPFTIFTVNQFINQTAEHDKSKQVFLNQTQIEEMVNLVDFAHHGLKHDNLMDLNEAMRHQEISESVNQMRHFKHQTLNAWAYTYGAYPKKNKEEFGQLKTWFKEMGIKCAFRIGNRINQLPLKDPFQIERIDVRGEESFWKFRLKVRFGKLF